MRRPLDAAELADAAVSAALVVALLTIGRLFAAGTFFQILATIVMTVLGARRRTRAVAAGTVASMALTLLLGGIGPISQAFVSGIFGWACGRALQRGYGLIRHVGLALLVCWPVVSAFTLAFLAVFSDLRELSFENARNQWLGFSEVLARIGLEALVEPGTETLDWSIDHWWLMVPLLQAGITIGYALIVRRIGRAVLRRVDGALGPAWSESAQRPDQPPAPLPVTLAGPTIDRPGGHTVDLPTVAQRIDAGDFVALLGNNGTGKTSLLDGLAGLADTTGVDRPGATALGAAGGTALVGQRPETQVVGLRVIDDMRWGAEHVADGHLVAALDAVGLGALADHPTSKLSGGELQRLAVAAALVRKPALLLSDESTSMLDPQSRDAIVTLLRTAASHGTAVVHSTHLLDEPESADVRLTLDNAPHAPRRPWVPRAGGSGTPLLTATGVGHVHDHGTPWARRALADVNLTVAPGQLVLVAGANGSGKTTLARLLSGLSLPTEGTVELSGERLAGPTPRISIAFQHARLQLMRSTVLREVASLAGTLDDDLVHHALELLGLAPAEIGARTIDSLSGGQQRRVLLAGIVARGSEVVILDEPLAGLDAEGRNRLQDVVEALLDRGTAVVLVSHDPGWVADRADVTVDLDAHVLEPERA